MQADAFFSQKITKRYAKCVEAERFTLTPVKARKKLSKKVAKVSTDTVVFTERQLQIAVAALEKGKP
jgi:hypothetical protein